MQIEEGVENLGRDPIAGDKEYFMPRKVAAAETSASPLVDESLTPVSKAEALAMRKRADGEACDTGHPLLQVLEPTGCPLETAP